MSSKQSMLAQVMEITGATRVDVVRVATHGGTTQDDWEIATAIADITRRPVDQIMWGHSGAALAPANPEAVYDKTVTIYAEDSSGLVTDTPETRGQDDDSAEEQDEDEQLRIRAWAAIANITSATREAIDRMVARWTTRRAIYTGVANVLRASRHPRARKLRTLYAVYALAA
ncbi:hypothetical protein [Nocardiopsis sp. JB363]|uniref:hypothetical protein n=1 Tax=Nocardiopsis sp. JB363 TaxID=1434837 RepID=UPI00097AC82D|nr:hypothetical protein [Nocardiopsis sp. JB363]SIO86168.1 hypothetical protein BQ8420_10635 [Nocardiopsis sp. JB363]